MTDEQPKIDKSSWGPGPWQDEPDRKEWKHAGFACLITRPEHHGALCGYVGVPPGHPWHGVGYDDVQAVVAHGGLTYAAPCRGNVFHVPEPGEPEDLWWLGFDHAHYLDLCPGMGRHLRFDHNDVYRDMDYATAGVESLAEQARLASVDINCCSSTVMSLCRSIETTKDYSLLPILADALQDADCNDELLLSILRNPKIITSLAGLVAPMLIASADK